MPTPSQELENALCVRRLRRNAAFACVVLTGNLAIVLLCFRPSGSNPNSQASQWISESVQEIGSSPLGFITNRVTGLIGVAVAPARKSGTPEIDHVVPNSPAERSGLQSGDLILEVNGRSTAGLPIRDVTAQIRGAAIGRTRLLIQRGDTNYSVIIGRVSWKRLQLR